MEGDTPGRSERSYASPLGEGAENKTEELLCKVKVRFEWLFLFL
jgi:hypothetical protein